MIATKHVEIYAIVEVNGWQYMVIPDGRVFEWAVSDDNVEGWWSPYDDCEDNFYEIQDAGLKVI